MTLPIKKKGYWDESGPVPKCSICGKESHSAQYTSERGYCPCCGSPMLREKVLVTK